MYRLNFLVHFANIILGEIYVDEPLCWLKRVPQTLMVVVVVANVVTMPPVVAQQLIVEFVQKVTNCPHVLPV